MMSALYLIGNIILKCMQKFFNNTQLSCSHRSTGVIIATALSGTVALALCIPIPNIFLSTVSILHVANTDTLQIVLQS
jgi:hypothetical protein